MNQISWFYLIDESGSPVASIEKYTQGGSGNANAFLSHFLFAIKSATKDLKDGEMKIMSISGGKFFITKDSATKYEMIVKAGSDAEPEKIKPLLSEIRLQFKEKFKDFFNISLGQKNVLIKEFQDNVKQLLADESNVKRFIKKK